MAVKNGSKMLNYVNTRMRVTVQDSRVLVGTFMAFDKHMNVVLGDTEEYRRVKSKNAEGKAEEREEKRYLGLVLLRGENIVSLQAENLNRAKVAVANGPGVSVPTTRTVPGNPAAMAGLMGPMMGVGGPALPGMMPPTFPGAMPLLPPRAPGH